MQQRLLFGIGIALFLSLFSLPVQARENITDWYIRDFRAEFNVHQDSTMIVTEWITADCDDLPDKHGIFRVLPTVAHTPAGDRATPVELTSITDFHGKPYQFTTSVNTSDDTITWKIGSPKKTVTGINEYKIVYVVKNIIRDQGTFDEWYWNVLGDAWVMPIDAFTATITFPQTVTTPEKLSVYSGVRGSSDNRLVETRWKNEQTLLVQTSRALSPGEGVTVSQVFPKGTFTLYQFSWWELYGKYLWFILPIIVFFLLYRLWKKHGDDPEWDKPIIPEYEIPEGFNMLTLGSLLKNGRLTNDYITAALIELAVKGVITIKKETEKVLFLKHDEYIFEKHSSHHLLLTQEQSKLLEAVFATSDTVKLSSLKNTFHAKITEIQQAARRTLITHGYFEPAGFQYQKLITFTLVGGIFLLFGLGVVLAFMSFSWSIFLAVSMSGVLALFFIAIMPKRTQLGVETHAKIQGLKLYMETAEKYRQQFHEKEGLFETLLPVAILFGMTKEWIKKMEHIYGADYFATYHPIWFVGNFDDGFSAQSFISAMESVSSSIASNMGTNSGSSGGGSSGGGGGGGGGGGW